MINQSNYNVNRINLANARLIEHRKQLQAGATRASSSSQNGGNGSFDRSSRLHFDCMGNEKSVS